MKKLYTFLLFLLFLLFISCLYISIDGNSLYKVFKIISPNSIFIDFNKNFIFDEKKPLLINNIYYIKSYDDYSEDEIFRNLSSEEKLLFEYFANEASKSILKNKFVKIKNDKILIGKKCYKNELIKSGYFYDDTEISKKNLLNKIKSINIDDYVILNIKTKKYHKLSCPNAKITEQYKIIHKDNLGKKYLPAKCCFLKNNFIISNLNEYNKEKISPNNIYFSNSLVIYFLDLNSIFSPNNSCSTEACLSLKNLIDSSKESIDFALYGFNNQPLIYEALKNAKKRGVKIRWVSNYDQNDDKYYPDIEKLKEELSDFKTNDNSYSSGIMHNKFFIIDKKLVFTGSANITSTDLSGFNANYSILIDNSEIAQIYSEEFLQMYNGNFSKNKISKSKKIISIDNKTKINVLFSPQDNIIDKYIIKLIDNAENYIYISAFFITNKNMLIHLQEAKKRGVEIRIINDATNASSKYTIHKELRKLGIKVKTENYAGKMHMKTICIDNKYTIIGSMNFTSNGNFRNDENVLIIENEGITTYIKNTFLYLWNKIPQKYENKDPKAESLESIGSCFDGIDNDFDKKIDKEDEGCFIKK